LSGFSVLVLSVLSEGFEVVDLVKSLDFNLGDFNNEDQLGNSGVDGGEGDFLEVVEGSSGSLNSSEDVGLE
jgi:hypothetical protein